MPASPVRCNAPVPTGVSPDMDHAAPIVPGSPPNGSSTPFGRLDAAVDRLLAEAQAAFGAEPQLARLILTAARIRDGLPLLSPGPLFAERLASRLLSRPARGARPLPRVARWALHHSPTGGSSVQRALITGAIGSAALSVAGVTALAVWRAAHRS